MRPAADLRARVAPTVLAHEQTVPVRADLADLFTDGGLVKGRVLACTGAAPTSTAMALVAAAVDSGAWLAVVDIPTFGLDAASEAGIVLERVVAISTHGPGAGTEPAGWAEVMAAVVDGFEVVLARVPGRCSAASLRKLTTRIRRRGAVVVLLGDPDGSGGVGAMPCDGVVESAGVAWSGLGIGSGHLRQRTIELGVSGRRLSGRRRCRMVLPRVGPPPSDLPALDGPQGVRDHCA